MRWLVPDLRGSEAPSQIKDTQAPKAAVILMKTKSGFVPTRPIKGLSGTTESMEAGDSSSARDAERQGNTAAERNRPQKKRKNKK